MQLSVVKEKRINIGIVDWEKKPKPREKTMRGNKYLES